MGVGPSTSPQVKLHVAGFQRNPINGIATIAVIKLDYSAEANIKFLVMRNETSLPTPFSIINSVPGNECYLTPPSESKKDKYETRYSD
jgi:hypothetical protein